RQTSTTQEYPSFIDTFFVAHTVNGEFFRDEDRRGDARLEATGTYTDDEINFLARGGKQRGHIAGVGRVLPARATASPSTAAHESTLNSLHKKVDLMISLFKSDSKYSDMFSQFESGGASGSGGCGDEDEDGDGDTTEMVSSVANSEFDKGNVCGSVTAVDTCRLADGCGWVELLMKATNEKRDQTYFLCNGTHSVDLKKSWGGHLNAKCGTIKLDREDGRILLDYVAIKDATFLEILVYYVSILHISLKPIQQLNMLAAKSPICCLHKSAMAVPANGCLKMQANLVDVDAKQRIVDETKDIYMSGSRTVSTYGKLNAI
nr:arginine--tRNA ligase, chloroplastic/mitochondrial [Tanacetum cinerariifolium]